ncbi:MAG: hypothetical protein CMM07_05230 [Rhodopirellula sp.]|nr:hypothetical protein [Rhodopirellula sp.]
MNFTEAPGPQCITAERPKRRKYRPSSITPTAQTAAGCQHCPSSQFSLFDSAKALETSAYLCKTRRLSFFASQLAFNAFAVNSLSIPATADIFPENTA